MTRPAAQESVTNIVIAGLGGQGVLTSAAIIADAAFAAGFDVKQSEIHGMSQRGGSVMSDIRFGPRVWSPMITAGEADYLLILSPGEEERTRHYLRPRGVLMNTAQLDADDLPHPSMAGVMLLGSLSRRLAIPAACWQSAVTAHVPARFLAQNLEVFRGGANR